MLLKSYAKINLYLNILSKTRGYHNIDSLFCYIDLYDIIQVDQSNKYELKADYEISSNENIIAKTIIKFNHKYGVDKNFKITHAKKIPIGGGMGGGSSNAATILRFLYNFYNINEHIENKITLAHEIGSDVPFFMQDNARYISSLGENIGAKCEIFELPIILINPIKINDTGAIFAKLQKKDFSGANNFKPSFFKDKDDFVEFLKQNQNDLYNAAIIDSPLIKDIHDFLLSNNIFVRLTGSGSTSFSICKDESEQNNIFNKLTKRFPNFFIIKTKLLNRI